jgi:putative transposase
MWRNHRLARAISDAAWGDFARLLRYKARWRGGQIETADRWYPSSQLCSQCDARNTELTLSDRVFICINGHCLDRDFNAAINLAAWGEQHHHDADPRARDRQGDGPVTNVRRREGADQQPTCAAGETGPKDAETDVHPAPAA